MKFVVAGARGQLGSDLVPLLGHDVVATSHDALDVGDDAAVRDFVRSTAPDVVVNCAAWTSVDACESDPERAHRDNALAVGHLAAACAAVDAHLVTISTDYVFDGTKLDPYVEADEPNPQSVYGRSKLAGERLAGSDATIVRTSWVCGAHGPNMVKTILRLLDERPTLQFVADQVGHPTFTTDLAQVVARLARDRRSGVFHATNQGAVSWFEFARIVAETAGHHPDRVQPIASADLDPPRPAPRPANSVLDNAALRAAGDPETRHFREPLTELIARLRA